MVRYFLSLLILGFALLTSKTALTSEISQVDEELPPCLKECREAYKAGKPMKDFLYSPFSVSKGDYIGKLISTEEKNKLKKELIELETCDKSRSTCWQILKKTGRLFTGADVFSDCNSKCVTQYYDYI